MTREEARQWFLKVYSEIKGRGYVDENEEAYEMAIKALSQEPCEECKYKTFTELYFHTDPEMVEQEPCETCGYAEGSPFCLQYCPYDAERKKEQEPCDDAVSRERALEPYKGLNNDDVISVWMIKKNINELPPVTQKSKTGHWIHLRCDMYECSECGKIYTSFEIGECDADYCPKCGVEMEIKE